MTATVDAPVLDTPVLEISGLSKTYASRRGETLAVGRLDMSLADNEFVSIVGPSGCGKTTLLKCISGLIAPTAGTANLLGRRIETTPRELAIVFQDYSRSLFPWLTARANVALPLRGRVAKREAAQSVEHALNAVGLDGSADHHPWQLSGGMQQRVAIARALAYRPRVLLLDEPFASVDAQTRTDLEDLVLQVRAEFGMTILLVTHDIDEAVYMSDRIVVLSKRPSTVVETVEVGLPTPRDQVRSKELPDFAHLRTHIYRLIKAGSAPDGLEDHPVLRAPKDTPDERQ